MTIYAVEVRHLIHTCPANPEPHEIDTRRRVVHVIPGLPCLTPVTIRCGDQTAVIPCGRHEPSDRQCAHCRTIITTQKVIIRDLGYQGPQPTLLDREVPA